MLLPSHRHLEKHLQWDCWAQGDFAQGSCGRTPSDPAPGTSMALQPWEEEQQWWSEPTRCTEALGKVRRATRARTRLPETPSRVTRSPAAGSAHGPTTARSWGTTARGGELAASRPPCCTGVHGPAGGSWSQGQIHLALLCTLLRSFLLDLFSCRSPERRDRQESKS